MFKLIKKIASNNVVEANPIEPTEAEVKSTPLLPETPIEFLEFVPLDIEAKLPEFPVNTLHPVARDFILSAVETVQAPIDLVASCVLGALSIACRGKYPVVLPNGHEERPCLYLIVIAPPSERKTGAFGIATQPLTDYEIEYNKLHAGAVNQSESEYNLLQGKIAKAEKQAVIAKSVESKMAAEHELRDLNNELAEFVRIVPLRLSGADVTPEKLACLLESQDSVFALVSDEGGGVFENIGRYNDKGELELYLKAYSGSRVIIDRKSSDSIIIDKPTLNILATCQPYVVKELFSDGQKTGRGLLTRMTFIKSSSLVGKRSVVLEPIDKNIEDNYRNLCFRMLESKIKGSLEFDDIGFDVYKSFHDEIESQLTGELSDIAESAGKLHGLTTRLAGLLHCIESFAEGKDPLDTMINADQTRAAVELARYFLAHAKSVYTEQTEPQSISDARYLWERIKSIKSTNPIPKRELIRKTQGKKDFDLNNSLTLLSTRGYIKIVRGSSGKAGKPSETIFINPDAMKVMT